MNRVKLVAIAMLLALPACTSSNLDAGLNEQVSSKPMNSLSPPGSVANAQQPNSQTASLLPEAGNPNAASQAAQPVNLAGPVTFLPVTGAPQSTVGSLSGAIRKAAQDSSIGIVPSSEQAKYEVKGYFSALDDGNGTLLVYVWDVLDKSGKRVHRISGQERTSSKSADPWSAVSQKEIDRVANNTMGSLKSWLARNT